MAGSILLSTANLVAVIGKDQASLGRAVTVIVKDHLLHGEYMSWLRFYHECVINSF